MFDTNAVSALVHRAKGFERIAARVEALGYGERLLSTITLSELQTMIEKAAQPRAKSMRVWQTLVHFRILAFDEEAARHAGLIRADLEPRGTAIGPLDTLIAAHARSVGATVVTDNIAEFRRVCDLRIENWQR